MPGDRQPLERFDEAQRAFGQDAQAAVNAIRLRAHVPDQRFSSRRDTRACASGLKIVWMTGTSSPSSSQTRRRHSCWRPSAPRVGSSVRMPVQSSERSISAFGVDARAFQRAFPLILHAVVGDAEAAGRRDLHEIPVVGLFETRRSSVPDRRRAGRRRENAATDATGTRSVGSPAIVFSRRSRFFIVICLLF